MIGGRLKKKKKKDGNVRLKMEIQLFNIVVPGYLDKDILTVSFSLSSRLSPKKKKK